MSGGTDTKVRANYIAPAERDAYTLRQIVTACRNRARWEFDSGMLRPLEQFRCDSCNGIIDDARDGWLEWYVINQTGRIRGYHIVHRSGKCAYDATSMMAAGKTVTRMPLGEVAGPRALGFLLRRLDTLLTGSSSKPADIRLFVDVIRRLQLRYYEEARLFWGIALRESVHDGTVFSEDVLCGIVEWKDAAMTSGVAALSSVGIDYVTP